MTTGPVRVEVYTLGGKLLFSGVAQTATLSPNRGECALTLASNARAAVPPLEPSMAAHRADQQGAGR